MKTVSMFLALVLMVSLASIALARGAPNENAFTDQAIVSVDVAPTVANVPPMTVGYDVICNLTTPAYSRPASVQYTADTSDASRLSTTGDERGLRSSRLTSRTGAQPAIVLLA